MEELGLLQKKCLNGVAHQRYRIKKLQESLNKRWDKVFFINKYDTNKLISEIELYLKEKFVFINW